MPRSKKNGGKKKKGNAQEQDVILKIDRKGEKELLGESGESSCPEESVEELDGLQVFRK